MRTLLLLSLFLALALALQGTYENVVDLRADPLFRVHWTVDESSETVSLAVEAATTGWVSFGIPEQTSGSMPGSDLFVGWVDDTTGAVYVEDRFALAKATPSLDDCQSWNLVAGEQTETTTTIEVTRALDTEDPSDRPIPTGLGIIIWAQSPDNSDAFGYHGVERKSEGFNFYGAAVAEPPTGDTITEFAWRTGGHEISTNKTTYVDFFGQFPAEVVASKHHLVQMETFVSEAGKPYVHHFLLYGCQSTDPTDRCTQIWAWAPGIGPNVLPARAGFAIGTDAGQFDSFRANVHFNNPAGVAGVLDNSGIDFWFDSELREFDAGVILLGDSVVSQSKTIGIGSGTASFEYSCPSECTTALATTITIWGDFLHMHEKGNKMWSTVWRDEEMIRELNRIEFWDFNFQQMTPIDSFELRPGDRINTHCVYNQDPSTDVIFGLASDEEMCGEFIYYYPAIPGATLCGFVDQTFLSGLGIQDDSISTICGGFPNFLNVTQPEFSDPEGGEEVRFAASEAPTCETVIVEIIPESSESSSSFEVIGSSSASVVATSFGLLALSLSILY